MTVHLQDSSDPTKPMPQKGTNGAGHVLSEPSSDFISQQALTLSASSQSLTIPSEASGALIRIQGGTVTDLAYMRLDGSAPTDATDSMILRNVLDTTLPAPNVTEVLVRGNLGDIRLLGTANASTALVWYFK